MNELESIKKARETAEKNLKKAEELAQISKNKHNEIMIRCYRSTVNFYKKLEEEMKKTRWR